ncbi:MAG: hypothetical protein JWO92_1255 [Chitinophagaceae bacterium]|nr:hypothetical protein [Chitinophagaceae bacterium]
MHRIFAFSNSVTLLTKNIFVIFFFLFLSINSIAQKAKADSLEKVLQKEKVDSNKVFHMWNLASITKNFDPLKALAISRQSLFLAEKIKYIEGQSKSLGIIAGTFIKIGNYPRALEYYFEKLKLEEKRDNPGNLASVLMNIGAVYVYQEEYSKALYYYYKSDSIIRGRKIEDLKYYSLQNLGDVYDKLNVSDSSYIYFTKALVIAKDSGNIDFMGASMTGLGHSYQEKENFPLSLFNYRSAISYLQAANDDDLLCEATLGLANLYQKLNRYDSAEFYAKLSLAVAQQDKFLLRDLEAAKFLANHYKKLNRSDSAFSYLEYVQVLNDSINSKSRIRESQVMSSNEQIRQIEIEENKKIAQQARSEELQLLLIGIFIPTFFLLTLLLSRIKMDVRVVKLLGVASLLFLFEYLTLLLHPFVTRITHHTPVYELLIYVSIAAILIPIHHRIERLMIEKLVHNKQLLKLTMKTAKFKMKDPAP